MCVGRDAARKLAKAGTNARYCLFTQEYISAGSGLYFYPKVDIIRKILYKNILLALYLFSGNLVQRPKSAARFAWQLPNF